ncbi:MAG TPA: hypothetical protein VFS23_25610 [Vicinamibacterales bacterium]|nr:hypothetical protein [Vicinamibacterales bacterium]
MRRGTPILALIVWLAAGVSAYSMETRILELRAVGPTLRASLDLRDIFSEKFLEVLDGGNPLHVRIQAELWEDRPVWDKLVRPAIVSAFRIIRDPNKHITVQDPFGVIASLPDNATPVPLRVEVAPTSLVNDATKYYLKLVATVGTIQAEEAVDTGEAVFGGDDSTISVARFGKLIFNTVVQVADYLQSVTSEARTRPFTGREARAGLKHPS